MKSKIAIAANLILPAVTCILGYQIAMSKSIKLEVIVTRYYGGIIFDNYSISVPNQSCFQQKVRGRNFVITYTNATMPPYRADDYEKAKLEKAL